MAKSTAPIDVLLKEYDVVVREILARTEDIVKIVGYGLTLMGVGLTIGLDRKINAVLLVLPLGAFGILYYYVNTVGNVLLLRGYKKHLASQINAIVGKRTMVWESVFENHVLGNLNRKVLDSIFFAILVFTVSLSIYIAVTEYNTPVILLAIIVNAALFIVLMLLVYRVNKRYDLGFKAGLQASRTDIDNDKER